MQKGRFERLGLLGSGTTTVTESARVLTGPSAGRIVTLVRLLPHAEADAGLRQSFIEKAQGLMRVCDDNIVEALELGRGSTHYLAREYVEGHSLRRLLKKLHEEGKQLPVGFACDVVVQLGACLISLRNRLHPMAPRWRSHSFASSIRTLVFDPGGRPRWVDPFALDDASEPRACEDPARDEAHALGALLYELCVGNPPPAVSEMIEFALVAPSTFSEQVPRGLDALVGRALGFGPEPSFQSVGEFTDAIDAAATGLGAPDRSWWRAVVGAPVTEHTPVEPPPPQRGFTAASSDGRDEFDYPSDLLDVEPASVSRQHRTINERPPAAQRRAHPTPQPSYALPFLQVPASPPKKPMSLAPLRQVSSSRHRVQEGPRRPQTASSPMVAASSSFPIGEAIMQRSQVSSMRVRAIMAGAIVVVAASVLIVIRSQAPSHVAIAAPPSSELPTRSAEPRSRPTVARPGLELGKLPPPEFIVEAPSRRVRRGARGRAMAALPRETITLAPTSVVAAPPADESEPPPPALAPVPAPPPAPLPAPVPKPAPLAPASASKLAPWVLPTPTPPVSIPYSAYVSSRRISGENPRIPPALRSRMAAGSALARICVGVDGRVQSVTVIRATTEMEDPLREAVGTWRYKPFLLKGRAVPVCFEMPFAFRRSD